MQSDFWTLIDCARRPTVRVWAQSSPFELKDALKARGYRWNDGTDGRPKSWFIDVAEDSRDAELSYLKNEIYQRNVDIECRALTALDRFSRVNEPNRRRSALAVLFPALGDNLQYAIRQRPLKLNASSVGAVSQTSISSGLVRMTGIALG